MEYFPSWRYHKDKKPVLVKNAKEDEALGLGWEDSPAKFKEEKPAPPAAEPEAEPDALELGAALRAREKAIESKGKKKPK